MRRISRSFLLFIVTLLLNASALTANAAPKNPGYYLLKVYHYSNVQQQAAIDNFLQNTLLPSLHGDNLTNVGVFRAIANDTAIDKRMYVFIPFKSLKQWEKFLESSSNKLAENSAGEYLDAPYDKPAYSRIETIFLKAFKFSSPPSAPKLNTPKSERVYELRSYESPTEKLHGSKVHMFNEGGEIDIFSRLGFSAVFYSQVIFGARMPNLMYMTSFENMASRTEHWKAFSSDPAWKTLSAMKEYQHNVSKSEITFLRPTEYSDL